MILTTKLYIWGGNRISLIMLGGDGRSLRHCGGDIGCVWFSWNDGGGGGGRRKNYIIIHCHIPHPEGRLCEFVINRSAHVLIMNIVFLRKGLKI